MSQHPPRRLSSEPTRPLVRAPLRGELSRRGSLSSLGLGWAALTTAGAAAIGAAGRFLFPRVLYEAPRSFRAGQPRDFAVRAVDERFVRSHGVWIVRTERGFYALLAVCTHLGCTPEWLAGEGKFKCPCHGSGFLRSGEEIEGPAPRPLERCGISLAEDGQIAIDRDVRFRGREEWGREGAFLDYAG